MAATSATGRGAGMSNGKYKKANNQGCCGKSSETEAPTPPVKRGCSIKMKSCCGPSSGTKIRSCCNTRIKSCF